jgi:FkbM family methyltransferase
MDTPDPSRPGGLTREHVVWAYRLLLDREPESEDVIGPKLAGSSNTRELRNHLMTSREFRDKNPDFAQANDRTVVITELSGAGAGAPMRLFVDLSDHVIGLNIVRGTFETEEVAFMRSVLRPGDTALDVGAHIGFFAIQMAAIVGREGQVHAFEPLATNAELLERSAAENHFRDRMFIHPCAVGSESGSATLTYAAETLNTGGAYLLRDETEAPIGQLKTTVRLVALDDVEIRHPVRFIKMDVEGAEPQVVRGAMQMLRADRPIILSELHATQLARASATTIPEFVSLLRSLGYQPRDLSGTPVERTSFERMPSVVFWPDALP